ncbi:MAG: nitroreductase family protein [Planctomycetes bacterium]|nr:nitroreductase family protein [Planctomycetota bacterium]
MAQPEFVSLNDRYDPGTTPEDAAQAFHEIMSKRRTVREYSDRPVSEETIRWLIRCAGSAPSGANKQPWRFVCVKDPDTKREIRLAAEEEERAFYERRAGREWLKDLEPLGTDSSKPFIEMAPWVIVAFKLTKADDGGNVYYINESVGLACGFLLAAAHAAGLATLTHTPSPMGFLSRVLGRPEHERPFLLIPVGYPADDVRIPKAALSKKPLDEIMLVR